MPGMLIPEPKSAVARSGCHGHVGFLVLLCNEEVRSRRHVWWIVAELWPRGPGRIDLGFQGCGRMKEWNPDSCIMDQGNDAIGGSPDHVIMGGVCNGVIPDLIDPGS